MMEAQPYDNTAVERGKTTQGGPHVDVVRLGKFIWVGPT